MNAFKRALLPLCLFIAANSLSPIAIASEAETIIFSQALDEHINQLADRLADAIHTQDSLFAGRDPAVLIDQFLTQELAKQIEISREIMNQIPDAEARMGSLKLSDGPFHADSFTWDKAVMKEKNKADTRGAAAIVSLLPSMITLVSGFLFSHNDTLVAVGGGGLVLGVLASQFFEVSEKQTLIGNAKFQEKLSSAVREAFFRRLVENGIAVPKKNREEWFLNLLEGKSAVAPWENLSNREKSDSARKYSDFLRNLAAVVSISKPDVSAELLAQARQLETAIDGARWYRFQSFRALQSGIVSAVDALAKLDKEHGFLSSPEALELNYRNRVVYEFPEIFTPEAREKLKISRIELPEVIRAYAPRLLELGGTIDLQIQNRSGEADLAAKRSKIFYQFTVNVPDREKVTFGVELIDKDAIRMGPGRELRLPSLDPVEFRRRLSESLNDVNFSEKMHEAYEAKFPEVSCKHALSTGAKQVREAVQAIAMDVAAGAL